MFKCPYHPLKNVCVCAALTCCTSDIPATRKLCGFVGHSAKLGCSKCSKEFSSLRANGSNKRDYLGFDISSWPPRCLLEHKTQASNHLNADNRQQQKDIEAEFGIRYSVLLELPYWNPIRFSVVDIMHNVYFGTAKHVMKVWVEKNCITKIYFKEIECSVSKIKTPRSVGRLPLKIASGFSGFTADQWKNWITVFSPVALKHILNSADYRCWLLFVRACFLLSNRIISTQAIDEIHHYLTHFCKHFEELYGADACTPNMHLHLHLKDCLKDYGPAHSFRVYSFERYNGILGRYHSNNHNIEVQLMRKFLCETQIQSLEAPSEAVGLFNIFDNSTVSSVHDTDIRSLQSLVEYCNLQSDYSITSHTIALLPSKFQGILHKHEMEKIKAVYAYMYPGLNIVHYSYFYESSKKCIMAGEIFSVSSVITAFWPTESFNSELSRDLQIGTIQKFIKHAIKVRENNQITQKMHIFCMLEWNIRHRNAERYGSSVVVCMPFTYCSGACQYMPIQRIAHHCAHGKLNVTFSRIPEEVVVAIPINLKFSL